MAQMGRHLVTKSYSSMLRFAFWAGIRERRENLDAIGWRYRNAAVVALLLVAASIVAGSVATFLHG
jgi:hypothetical protein